MYRSPIDIVYQNLGVEVGKKLDSDIYTAVVECGINVDKGELIRALKYDRGQYEKGYMDGRADARAEIVRCKDCEKGHPELAPNGGAWCAKWNHVFCDDGFCSYGERRCDNEVD